jgi:hypothetical protein
MHSPEAKSTFALPVPEQGTPFAFHIAPNWHEIVDAHANNLFFSQAEKSSSGTVCKDTTPAIVGQQD